MKRVPSLAAEPAGLAAYRAAHPDDVAAPRAQAARVWERFKDDRAAYHGLRAALLDRQQGLCAYCEQRLLHPPQHARAGDLVFGDYQIEHVEPKSTGQGAVLDWQNLVMCCGGGTYTHTADATRYDRRLGGAGDNESCGQAKGDLSLAPGCDPRAFDWRMPPVTVNLLDGRVVPDDPACRAAGIDPDALKNTIDEILQLNCERLRYARTALLKTLEDTRDITQEVFGLWSGLDAEEQARLLGVLCGSELRPDSHGCLPAFWTARRVYFGPLAERWIAEHSDVLNFA